MDIISYGVANKAGAAEKKSRNTTLADGVEGNHPHVKSRIDNIEKSFEGLTLKANQLIVNDAINIMKAHARLNAIAGSMKYKMHNMIFDDLLDLSGIDIEKSSGYTHDSILGEIKSAEMNDYVIETRTEMSDSVPEKVILSTDEARVTSYNLLFDGKNQITFGDLNTPPPNSVVVIKAKVKFDNLEGHQPIFSDGGYIRGIEFGLYNNELHLAVENNNSHRAIGYSTENLEPGSWYDVEAIADGPGGKMYIKVDNVVVSQNENLTPFTDYNGTSGTSIGGTNNQSPSADKSGIQMYFEGLIKEVQIWSTYNLSQPISHVQGDELGLKHAWIFTSPTQDKTEVRDLVTGQTRNISKFSWDGVVDSAPIIGVYYISRDAGVNWEKIDPDNLFYFDPKISPPEKELRIKAELPYNVHLLNYALTWA